MTQLIKGMTHRLPEVPPEVKDDTDQVIDQVLEELRIEDGVMDEINEEVIKDRKRRRRKKVLITFGSIFFLAALYLFIYLQTYTGARISNTYELAGSGNVSFQEFGDGILRYSRDGIALINHRGDEVWNQPYQMKNPILGICPGQAVACADKGANSIVVCGMEGLRGEMQTTLPIRKVAVSAQGIVCAVLESEPTPKIVCFDAMGNLLVEMTTSLTGTGYPMDVALSEDGKKLMAAYLSIQDGQMVTKVRMYDFSEIKETSADYEIMADEYPDMAAATVYFAESNTAVVAGDDRILIYDVKEAELKQTITPGKKIKSICFDNRSIGLVLRNEGKGGCELKLYHFSGKEVLSKEFTGDYSHVKLSGYQVILYDGRKARIYTRTGILRFDGEMDIPIMEIVPVFGINKYIVMQAGEMDVVRLVK